MIDGKDLRREKLTDRKHELRRLLSGAPKIPVHYADHVEGHGTAFVERVCRLDLEGIVAKHEFGSYTTDERTTRFKINNQNCLNLSAARNCSSVTGTKNQCRAGIVVILLVRRWDREMPTVYTESDRRYRHTVWQACRG